ncbi:MAG TPA: glycosyltransferase, partial [Gemmatimonadales bacterium]|nr:glycosyltransferase [Gemmatimonadales bacterium]
MRLMGRSPQSHHGLRILHMVVPGTAGGLETVVRLLARSQRDGGSLPIVSTVVESDPGAHPFIAALRAEGTEVRAVRVNPRAYLAEWRALFRLCRHERPDVVHTHGARSDVIGGLAARVAQSRWISTAHGFTGGDTKNRLYERLQMAAYRRADAVAAVSEPLRKKLAQRGVPERRLHLVRNAWSAGSSPLPRLEARGRLGLPPDRPVLGWVGRLSREKGLDLLIDAVARLDDPRVMVAVVGDGAERPALQAQAAALGLGDRIRWHGPLPEAAPLFSAFDLYVLSSRTEGTPMVLFEAMAAGVPIVAARVGGVPDILDAEAGWLVTPDD